MCFQLIVSEFKARCLAPGFFLPYRLFFPSFCESFERGESLHREISLHTMSLCLRTPVPQRQNTECTARTHLLSLQCMIADSGAVWFIFLFLFSFSFNSSRLSLFFSQSFFKNIWQERTQILSINIQLYSFNILAFFYKCDCPDICHGAHTREDTGTRRRGLKLK